MKWKWLFPASSRWENFPPWTSRRHDLPFGALPAEGGATQRLPFFTPGSTRNTLNVARQRQLRQLRLRRRIDRVGDRRRPGESVVALRAHRVRVRAGGRGVEMTGRGARVEDQGPLHLSDHGRRESPPRDCLLGQRQHQEPAADHPRQQLIDRRPAQPPVLLSAALTFAGVRAPCDAGRHACTTLRTAGECTSMPWA